MHLIRIVLASGATKDFLAKRIMQAQLVRLHHRDGLTVTTRQSTLNGCRLRARLNDVQDLDARRALWLTTKEDPVCKLEQLEAFVRLCEHRWALLREPLPRLELIRLGQLGMVLIKKYEAHGVLQCVREAVKIDPWDVIVHLRLTSKFAGSRTARWR